MGRVSALQLHTGAKLWCFAGWGPQLEAVKA